MKTKSIGTVTYPFMGEFDGQGHKITGLTLSNSDSGLFWYIGATGYVHNLTIDSANVLFSDNAATLTPDPLYSAFYSSHPDAAIRIATIQKEMSK